MRHCDGREMTLWRIRLRLLNSQSGRAFIARSLSLHSFPILLLSVSPLLILFCPCSGRSKNFCSFGKVRSRRNKKARSGGRNFSFRCCWRRDDTCLSLPLMSINFSLIYLTLSAGQLGVTQFAKLPTESHFILHIRYIMKQTVTVVTSKTCWKNYSEN